jgi:HK97 family phage portal protein
MGFLARAVAEQKSGVYERWMELLSNGAKSKAGPGVSRENIWRVSAALACMRVRAHGVAQVPFKLFQETEEVGLKRIRPARDHSLYDKVTAKPNAWQTSFELREQIELHLCLGNAYVFLNRYRGKVEEMFVLNGVRAEQQEDLSTRYWARGKSGQEREVPASDVWHLRGLSWDGFMGMDTLNMAREAVGLSVALEESAASLHANGVRPSGVYSVEGTLNEKQQKDLVAWLKREAAAPGATMVLDRNAKWLSTAMTSIDAQHKEMRDQQLEEVCRFFGVLPIMIGYTGDKATTYASAEAMFTAHKVHTLAPEYTRIQESADVNLLTDKERADGYYFKFAVNALAWASMKDQAEYFAKALGAGGSPAWHSQDEIRAFVEFDPMGGEAAKLPPLINKAPVPPATP